MNVEVLITQFDQKIASLRKQIRWIKKRRKILESLPEGSMFGDQIDFDKLTHKEVIQVIKALGGKWKKEVNAQLKETVDYTQDIDGMRVRCWQGQPPPSCRIVEVEEVIPAHTVQVPEQKRVIRKMVCSGQDPLVVAIARANSPATT